MPRRVPSPTSAPQPRAPSVDARKPTEIGRDRGRPEQARRCGQISPCGPWRTSGIANRVPCIRRAVCAARCPTRRTARGLSQASRQRPVNPEQPARPRRSSSDPATPAPRPNRGPPLLRALSWTSPSFSLRYWREWTRQAPNPLTKLVSSAPEFRLLHFLDANAGEVVSRERMLSEIWGYDFDPHSKVVEVCVRRVRVKLAPHEAIETVRNVGYRAVAELPTRSNAAASAATSHCRCLPASQRRSRTRAATRGPPPCVHARARMQVPLSSPARVSQIAILETQRVLGPSVVGAVGTDYRVCEDLGRVVRNGGVPTTEAIPPSAALRGGCRINGAERAVPMIGSQWPSLE
jgi:DNA-binding winged helix-turn-helix (wHTH) protein